ncbi:ABC transporter ATP-binding protein [Ruania halotolerans]|uniref:ABC transporter ATP-binding protein n=1 Tax=Ruania halotolerans TaxID=2897773 RepID=UPI001E36EC0D|nr:ATP-binding cassette domain-containing protein [Ruania halotolerans]UFU05414.1 ATP-binding cassette domain-containing protein [Ruania halotolerans]
MAGSVLQAHDLWGGYPGNPVINGVELTITAGDPPLGIVGPSGVGKTTLARLLRGTERPTRGDVTFNGRSVRRLPRREAKEFRAAVRFQSQDSMTITDPRLTVAANLKEALKIARKAGRTHATTTAELLDAVALPEHFGKRAMITLSGGERQRVALATALATRPELLVLDEPFTAVDPQTRGEMARRLGSIFDRLGTAAVVISHDLELVERMCPSVHFLAEGRFVASGPLGEVFATAEHPAVREMAEAAPLAVQRFG